MKSAEMAKYGKHPAEQAIFSLSDFSQASASWRSIGA